jgi:hypothetical protein
MCTNALAPNASDYDNKRKRSEDHLGDAPRFLDLVRYLAPPLRTASQTSNGDGGVAHLPDNGGLSGHQTACLVGRIA